MKLSYLKTKDFAKQLGVGSPTVRTWIKKGLIQTVRIGREYLIPLCEVERLKAGVLEGRNDA